MKKKSKASVIRIVVSLVIVILLYLLPFSPLGTQNALRIGLSIALYCTLGQMWNLMSGYAGMTSLGQQIFIGLSGYSIAVVTSTYGLPFWVGMILGGVISAIAAFLLSVLLLRMRGMYFAIATWVVAEALAVIFTSWDFVKRGAGMTIKAKPYPPIADIYLLAVTLAIVSILVIYFILNSRTGLGLTAMRDDADAASSVGVNIFRSKLMCFMVSGFFTGICGSLFYLNQGSIFPGQGFGNSWTVAAVFIVIIGGVGTMTGPLIGAAVYVMLQDYLSKYPGFSMIILGAIAIVVIMVMPNGIVGTLERKFKFELLSSRRQAHDIAPPDGE